MDKSKSKPCPYCGVELEIKNDLLYCPSQAIFIGSSDGYEKRWKEAHPPGEIAQSDTASVSGTVHRSKSKIIFKVIVLGVLVVGGYFGYVALSAYRSSPEVEQRVNVFFQLVSDKDFDAIPSLLPPDAPEEMKGEFSEVAALAFADFTFKEQTKTGFSYQTIKDARSSKFNLLSYTVAYTYLGTVTDVDDSQAEFALTFIRKGGEWRLIHFNIGEPY